MPALMATLTLLFLAAALRSGYYEHGWRVPQGLAYGMAVVCGLVTWFCFGLLRASFHPANWILRITDTSIVIKYRSFLNRHFPAEDLQAVELTFAELAAVRQVKETQQISGPTGRSHTAYLTHLEFTLRNCDAKQLEEQLNLEIKRKAPMINRSSTKWQDYPVTVTVGGIIRVRWNMVVPGIKPTLAKLRHLMP